MAFMTLFDGYCVYIGRKIMEIKYDVSITAIGNLARTFRENNKSAILLDEGIRIDGRGLI